MQSIDATFCAKKGAIQLGTKPPSGNALECSTGHISPETGNCAKSKEQEEFELYIMIGITVIILISLLSFIALKYLDYVKKVTPEK